ncbi:MAG: hypothetical protein K2L13_03050 [Opitutales bacterium]|nr:hypothetical protein [Opitutales bacterium]
MSVKDPQTQQYHEIKHDANGATLGPDGPHLNWAGLSIICIWILQFACWVASKIVNTGLSQRCAEQSDAQNGNKSVESMNTALDITWKNLCSTFNNIHSPGLLDCIRFSLNMNDILKKVSTGNYFIYRPKEFFEKNGVLFPQKEAVFVAKNDQNPENDPKFYINRDGDISSLCIDGERFNVQNVTLSFGKGSEFVKVNGEYQKFGTRIPFSYQVKKSDVLQQKKGNKTIANGMNPETLLIANDALPEARHIRVICANEMYSGNLLQNEVKFTITHKGNMYFGTSGQFFKTTSCSLYPVENKPELVEIKCHWRHSQGKEYNGTYIAKVSDLLNQEYDICSAYIPPQGMPLASFITTNFTSFIGIEKVISVEGSGLSNAKLMINGINFRLSHDGAKDIFLENPAIFGIQDDPEHATIKGKYTINEEVHEYNLTIELKKIFG